MAIGLYNSLTRLTFIGTFSRTQLTYRTITLTTCNYNYKFQIHQFMNKVNIKYAKEKFSDIVVWYEQLTGLDEVRMLQNRVIEAQEKFALAQERRREAGKELTRIQFKLKEIHSELDTTNRGEERYLQLITQEHAVLKEERKFITEFAIFEREERENFNLLTAFVRESHEKERAYAERTKYLSLIASVVGTLIGVAGSSINNEFKMRELRQLVRQTALKSTDSAGLTGLIEDVKSAVLKQRPPPPTSNKIPEDITNMLVKNQQEMRIITYSIAALAIVITIIPFCLNR